MGRSEDIRNTIWSDLDEVLSNDAMLLYIWSWTNERCQSSGIYPCSRRLLLEGRLERDALDKALAECEAAGKLRYVDGVVWSVTRVKHLNWKNPNAAKSILKELGHLDPDNPIRAEFVARYEGLPWCRDSVLSFDSPDGLAKGSGTHADGLDNGSVTHDDAQSQSQTPEPMRNGSGTVQGIGRGKGKGSRSTSDVTLLRDARPELGEVEQILGRIAETRGVAFADSGRVAAAIEAHAEADAVKAALDFEDYACNGTGRGRPIADLVQSFRLQLEMNAKRRIGPGEAPAPSASASEFDEYDQVVERA